MDCASRGGGGGEFAGKEESKERVRMCAFVLGLVWFALDESKEDLLFVYVFCWFVRSFETMRGFGMNERLDSRRELDV